MTKRCVLYARVSSTNQAGEDKTSLETQLDTCRQLAEREGWGVVAEVTDDVSGFTLNRPGLDKVRELVRAKLIDVVVVWKTQRLSREQGDTALLAREFRKHGVTIWSVVEGKFEDSETGKFLLQVYALAAELDRSARRDATTAGKRAKVKSGKVLGIAPRAPYGYHFRYEAKPNGKQTKIGYDVNEREATVVRRIYDLINSGHLPRAIANMLNDEGVRTTYADVPGYDVSGRWVSHSVRRLVKNEQYKGGKHAFAGVRQTASEGNRFGPVVRDLTNAIWLDESAVPAIVSVDTWAKANGIIESRLTRSATGPNTEDVWMRGGLAVCGRCGANLQLTRRKNGIPFLRCVRQSKETLTCPKPSPYIHSAVIERETWTVVRAILLDPTMLAARFRSTEQNELDQERVQELRTRLDDLNQRRQRLVGSLEFLDGTDLQAAIRRRDELIGQTDALRAELTTIEGPAVSRETEFERVVRLAEWLGQQPERLDKMSVAEKRAIAVELGVRVTVYPASAPERLKVDIGAWTSDEGFFEGVDWGLVSSQSTASELRFGIPVLQEAANTGETAELVRALQVNPAGKRNEQYYKWYCGLGLFNEFGAAKLEGIA